MFTRLASYIRSVVFSLILVMGVSMVGVGAWAAHEDSITAPPPVGGPGAAMSASELAYEMLALKKIQTGPLVDLIETLRPLTASGVGPDLVLDYVLTFPDGTTLTVTMRSVDELEDFMDMTADKFARLTPALKARLGPRPSQGNHVVRVGGACADVLPIESRANVTWDGNFFTLASPDMHFTGVAVDHMVMVMCDRDLVPPLVGYWQGGQLRLESEMIDCTIEFSGK